MTIEEAKELVEEYRLRKTEARKATEKSWELNNRADRLRSQIKQAGFEYLLAPPKEGA